MTSTEFAGSPGSYDPVSPEVFFSLPPMLGVAIVLGLLAFLLLGWFGRDIWGPKDADPCQGIWDAVNKDAQAAVKAPRDAVVSKARALRKTLDARLGGVIALSGGLFASRGAINALCDNRRPHGAAIAAAEPHAPAPATGPDRVIFNSGKLVIHNTPAADLHPEPGHDTGHGEGHDEHDDTPLGADEQIRLLRDELHRFADHWAVEADRLKDLRAARANLN